MNKYRHTLPRLDALIVFEAVVRCEGVTNAARELNVSQAAVSKRIRDLESYLGTTLLQRIGRQVIPTDAGLTLSTQSTIALDYLVEACAQTRGEEALNTLSIAADTAVSHYWLGPALRAFGTCHPSISVRVITSDVTSDLTSDNNDIAVLYGNGAMPGWDLKPLFGQTLRPVASPSYLSQLISLELDDIQVLSESVILDHSRKGPDWTDWKVWLKEIGLRDVSNKAIHQFDSYALAIDAAIDGQGIALASLPLLENLLKTNVLKQVTELKLETQQGYFLGRRARRPLSDNAQVLFDWLLDHNQ